MKPIRAIFIHLGILWSKIATAAADVFYGAATENENENENENSKVKLKEKEFKCLDLFFSETETKQNENINQSWPNSNWSRHWTHVAATTAAPNTKITIGEKRNRFY